MNQRKIRWPAVAALAVVVSLLAACERDPSGSQAPATRTIRIGYSGEADFIDLPSIIAQGRLRDRGYVVEATNFSATDIAIAAVAEGTVDIVHASMLSAWTAISRGARIRTVMEHVSNPYRMVATIGISGCKDFAGRRLGLAGEASVSAHIVRAYLEEDCPGAGLQEVVIGESSSRAAAFLAGGVDVGALELSSWLWLRAQAPDRFHLLSDLSTRWPHLKTTGVHANTDFAKWHPENLQAYLAALLAANEDVRKDPRLLVSAAAESMGRSEDWATTGQAYLDARVWPDRGGLAPADIESSLEFFKRHSRLDPALTTSEVADLTFLERALRD